MKWCETNLDPPDIRYTDFEQKVLLKMIPSTQPYQKNNWKVENSSFMQNIFQKL